jgi:hypothetical protein
MPLLASILPKARSFCATENSQSVQLQNSQPVILKPYLRVFRGLSKTNLPGYVGFFQFLRNFHQLTAFEQAEMILYAALDPTVAGKARKGDFVRWLDHFKLLQSPLN